MKKKITSLVSGDRDIEKIIGLLLRYGVIVSSVFVLTGGIIYLLHAGKASLPPYHTFIGEKMGLTTIASIFQGIAAMNPKAIIQLGVVLLIATPVLRVFFSLLGFLFEKDRLYSLLTLVVLTVMMISIFGGLKI